MVGNTLRRCTRTGDSVGPWGGEEFLVVATVTSTAEAIAVAERARKLVASTWIHQGDRLISPCSWPSDMGGTGPCLRDALRHLRMGDAERAR